MSNWAGHESGRGHGPGGRLWPMRGDSIEIRRPMTNDPPWDVVQVIETDSEHRVLVRGHGYTVPRILTMVSNGWRWPHLTALGIRGSVCCKEHGLIPGDFGGPPDGVTSGAIGSLDGGKKP